jgi:hypothetical protein
MKFACHVRRPFARDGVHHLDEDSRVRREDARPGTRAHLANFITAHALASGAKKKRAREDIAGLLSVITEGRDTPDLVDARAVVAS